MKRPLALIAVSTALALSACSSESATTIAQNDAGTTSSPGSGAVDSSQQFPDVLEVEATTSGESAPFAVTISSPYDTPERYADGWRVLDQDGEVLGEHTLGHDHASEQPFTRTQSGVDIPEGTTSLTIEGRDQEFGYGGEVVTLDWPISG